MFYAFACRQIQHTKRTIFRARDMNNGCAELAFQIILQSQVAALMTARIEQPC